MTPLGACVSAVPGRAPVNLLQRETRAEEEQHQRACTDSDHHFAHMPLRKIKRETRFQCFIHTCVF